MLLDDSAAARRSDAIPRLGLLERAGDQVLVAVVRRLMAATRAEDTVARIGGDEFVVVAA